MSPETGFENRVMASEPAPGGQAYGGDQRIMFILNSRSIRALCIRRPVSIGGRSNTTCCRRPKREGKQRLSWNAAA